MTPLRKRMMEDLQLKGYSPATQQVYLGAVRKLAKHYGRSPDTISEQELRAYFLRKVEGGKAKTLVLNNIANRLLRIICAVLRDKKPYIKGYRSMNPLVLKIV